MICEDSKRFCSYIKHQNNGTAVAFLRPKSLMDYLTATHCQRQNSWITSFTWFIQRKNFRICHPKETVHIQLSWATSLLRNSQQSWQNNSNFPTFTWYGIGKVPGDWREASIVPIFKKGERHLPSNYHPVSSTFVLCKLLEHIVPSQIMDHNDSNHIQINNTVSNQDDPMSLSYWIQLTRWPSHWLLKIM